MAVDLIARALAAGTKTSLTLAGLSLTGSQATSALVISATWNTSGTPSLIDADVADTASNAAALFVNIKRNGSALFSVGKNCVIKGTSNSTITLGTDVTLTNPNATRPINIEGFLNVTGAIAIGQSSGQTQNTADLTVFRDAADIWAQRRGTNAQIFRVSGTQTDTSNYRRVSIGMTTAGVGHIRPEGAGTGASGNVLHISGLPTSNPGPGILWNNANTVAVGT